jgi:O-antigen biosynthesis protein
VSNHLPIAGTGLTRPVRAILAHYPSLGRLRKRSARVLKGMISRNPLSIARRQFALRREERSLAREPDDLAGSADGQKGWKSYGRLIGDIAKDRVRNLAEIDPRPVPIIEIAAADIPATVADLRFNEEPHPTVSIIVPVFNNLSLTLECLVSIKRFTDERVTYEVIIADDASTDQTGKILPLVKGARYLKNEQNLGYLLNCNRAASKARGEYVLFLNNDAQVTEGWLFALVNAFRSRPNAGAAGPRIMFPNGRLQEAGVTINRDCTTNMVGLHDDPARAQYRFARRVDYCSGACLMVASACFAKVGGFNEALAPAYCEDVDLCLKLRRKGLDIWYVPDALIVHHLSKTSDNLDADYKMRSVITNQQKLVETWSADVDLLNKVRLFAFYLPQYHPIPENDQWWGKGFTEWANVASAKPQFVGHHQPQLPADLGFYDLRLPEVLREQARLAHRYGIEGFCFYYYWFGGKRLLERPLEMMLSSGEPHIPFLLCWANENWTRRWDGMESDVLVSQHHSDNDDAEVIHDLMRYFRDRRYVRIEGKPVLLIYRVDLFPDFARTAKLWRSLCRKAGIGEIYLALVESFKRSQSSSPPAEYGCDASVQFPPHGGAVKRATSTRLVNSNFAGTIYDYEASALSYLRQPWPSAPRFPAVMPSWDNTARRGERGTLFYGASPGAFQAWLEAAIYQTRQHNFGEERIVFINAWNEWAEGAHLEPDTVFGHAYLEAVTNALAADSRRSW